MTELIRVIKNRVVRFDEPTSINDVRKEKLYINNYSSDHLLPKMRLKSWKNFKYACFLKTYNNEDLPFLWSLNHLNHPFDQIIKIRKNIMYEVNSWRETNISEESNAAWIGGVWAYRLLTTNSKDASLFMLRWNNEENVVIELLENGPDPKASYYDKD